MQEVKARSLQEVYPKLLKHLYDTDETKCREPIAWGIETPEYWDSLIIELLGKLVNYPITITQIKEKFGGLRVYYDSKPDSLSVKDNASIRGAISYAESFAYNTCVNCGVVTPDVCLTRVTGWVHPSCPECTAKFEIEDDG